MSPTAKVDPAPGRLAAAASFVLLAAASLIPLGASIVPPILDYPNHLARMHVLAALDGSSDLAHWYRSDWAPIPDLALDLVVPALARIVPVEQAMRLALAAILLALAGGCVALHRAAFRRRSLWPLAAFLLLYNRMLLWGFLNYLAGLALALWALAAWIALERRPQLQRIVFGSVLATATWFAHLAAFGCYALAGLAYSATARGGGRSVVARVAPALATLVPGAALFLVSPTSDAPTGIAYGNPLRKLDLPVSIFDNYDRIFDGATFAAVLIAAIVGLAKGWFILDRRLRWSLAALLAAFVVLPSRLWATAGIDHRLPIAIAFLFVAATDWGGLSAGGRRVVAATLVGLLVLRLAIVTVVWHQADLTYQALMPAFALIGHGDAVAVAAPAESVEAGGIPLFHFPTLAVCQRDAFVPSLFADPSQQPIRFTPAAARLAAGANPAQLWEQLDQGALPKLGGFDDLMIVDPPRSLDISRLPGEVLFAAPRLVLVRLTPAASGSSP